jgi:hypothetical protein
MDKEAIIIAACKQMAEYLFHEGEKPSWFETNRCTCLNIVSYCFEQNMNVRSSQEIQDHIKNEIFMQEKYPFNKDMLDFVHESLTATLYKNKKRLAYIKEWSEK